MIPEEIKNKIFLYNIHPIAEILKPIILNIKNDNFYKCIFEYIYPKYCWSCHKNNNIMNYLTNKYYCDDCFYYTDPNDDESIYSPLELIELKTNIHSILYIFNSNL